MTESDGEAVRKQALELQAKLDEFRAAGSPMPMFSKLFYATAELVIALALKR